MKKVVLCFIAFCVLFEINAQKLLKLDECRQMALSHNKSLAMEQESIRAAQELKKAAFTQFLPNFSAVGSYTWNQKNMSLLAEDAMLPVGTKKPDGSFTFTPDQLNNQWYKDPSGKPIAPLDASGKPFDPAKNPEKLQIKGYALLPKEAMEFDIQNIFAGGINFIQPLFMGGKIKELYNLSKYNEQLAIAKKDNKVSELIIEVDEAYWRVISIENKLALAKEYRNLIAKLDTNMTAMVQGGVATKADGLKVKVKLNEADVTLSKAENGLSLSRMALNQLCGIPIHEQITLVDQELNTAKEMPKLVSIEEAFAKRPEINALRQVENIAKSNEKIMFSRFLPNIVMSGNYLVTNPNSFNGFQHSFGGMFSVGIVAQVPLFHFGEKIHTLNAAKSARKIAGMQMEEVKEKMELQINQCTYKTNESIKKLFASEQNIENAIENLRYATEGFEAGVITSTDLLMAQTAWLSAKSENVDASIDVRLCKLYLQKATGALSINN